MYTVKEFCCTYIEKVESSGEGGMHMCICVCGTFGEHSQLVDPKHTVVTTVTPGYMADHSSKTREDVHVH